MALKKAENIDTNLYQLEIAVDGDKFNEIGRASCRERV